MLMCDTFLLTGYSYMLIKKAVAVRKHLERNKKDKDSKVCP